MYRPKSLIERLHRVSILEVITLGVLIIGLILFLSKTVLFQPTYTMVPAAYNSGFPAFGVASTEQNCDATITQADYATANDFLTKVNEYRKSKGSDPLKLSQTLMKSAKWQSTDMNKTGILSHTDSTGRDPGQRMVDCGNSPQSYYGENIAKGQTSTSQVLSAWKSDAGHDHNLLNPDSVVMGFAHVGSMWTMDTGTVDDTQNSNGTPTPSPSDNLTITPTPNPTHEPSPIVVTSTPTSPPANTMFLKVTARFPGIGKDGNISPNHPSKIVSFSLYNSSNSLVASWKAPLNYTGDTYTDKVYVPSKVQPGKYVLKVKADGDLTHIVQPIFVDLNLGRTVTLPTFTFIVGDIDGNNTVDYKDYVLFTECIQKQKCSKNQIEDFNDDGVINLADYNLLLRSFSSITGE